VISPEISKLLFVGKAIYELPSNLTELVLGSHACADTNTFSDRSKNNIRQIEFKPETDSLSNEALNAGSKAGFTELMYNYFFRKKREGIFNARKDLSYKTQSNDPQSDTGISERFNLSFFNSGE